MNNPRPVDLNLMPEIIMDIGPEHLHINGDYGQPISYDPIEGMRIFLRMLLHWGISKADITTMIKTNPEKLMYLRD